MASECLYDRVQALQCQLSGLISFLHPLPTLVLALVTEPCLPILVNHLCLGGSSYHLQIPTKVSFAAGGYHLLHQVEINYLHKLCCPVVF